LISGNTYSSSNCFFSTLFKINLILQQLTDKCQNHHIAYRTGTCLIISFRFKSRSEDLDSKVSDPQHRKNMFSKNWYNCSSAVDFTLLGVKKIAYRYFSNLSLLFFTNADPKHFCPKHYRRTSDPTLVKKHIESNHNGSHKNKHAARARTGQNIQNIKCILRVTGEQVD
jgi:hypothetical protein